MKAVENNRRETGIGWTAPVDILLSPLKNEARLQDAMLDTRGNVHIIFYGGDGTLGNIYYATAPLESIDQASAWSKPIVIGESADDPPVAAIAGDDKGNMVVVYGGKNEGNGLYSVYSTDWGDTWTESIPGLLTYDSRFPFNLKVDSGESGLIHAVWDVRDIGGNGREINYAQLNLIDQQWSEPITLEEAESGYGVLNPSVIEYNGELFVVYSGLTFRRSVDGGHNWTDPENPFQLTGINGKVSFVIDSANTLHLVWAQRKSGNPDIHGVWHSQWLDNKWSTPEPVATGPRIVDLSGLEGFDPYDVRAEIVLGNTLLAVWRTDPGEIKANGIWYSVGRLDAPALPAEAVTGNTNNMPTPMNEMVASDEPVEESTAFSQPITEEQNSNTVSSKFSGNEPAQQILMALIPTTLLVVLVILVKTYFMSQKKV
ncbi:MAG: exo-alpha-sialidase [Anaerolineales bacterium]